MAGSLERRRPPLTWPAILGLRHVGDRVVAVIDQGAVEHLDDPTPCGHWCVRNVLDHMVGGSRAMVAHLRGAAGPDRAGDFIGKDPGRALRSAVTEEVVELSRHHPEELHESRLGRVPLADMVHRRTTELLVHGWDLGRALSAPLSFRREVVRGALDRWLVDIDVLRNLEGFSPGPVADWSGSEPLDRLAVLMGRDLCWSPPAPDPLGN